MLDKSFFITQTIHQREIVLADGKKYPIYIKELPNVHWRRHALVERNGTNEERADEVSRMVSLSLCNADGTQAVTFEDAQQIKTAIVIKMYDEVLALNQRAYANIEVDEAGKPKETPSSNTQTSGSGTSLD